jgi:hypothetical protein
MSGYYQDECCTPGCHNDQVVMSYNYNGTGEPGYRKWCSQCHNKRTAEKRGCKTIADVVALNAGFDSSSAYKNSKHPYRQYRKDYCENIDGRLGFTCTTTIVWDGQLDVDHKDEDPTNNSPKNLQTLCKCCHAVKGNRFILANGQTPGRKTLKEAGYVVYS